MRRSKRPAVAAPRGASTSIYSQLLIAFLLLVLGPALVIGLSSAWASYNIGRKRAMDQLDSIVTIKSIQIDKWTEQLGGSLDTLLGGRDLAETVRPLLQGRLSATEALLARERLLDLLNKSEAETGLFSDISLLDQDGRIVASTDAALEGRDLSGADYYQQGLQRNFIAPSARGSPRASIIVAAHPIIAPGRGAVGVLAGYSDFSVLDKIMEEPMDLGATGESYLISANYLPLTRLSDAPNPPVAAVRSEAVRLAIENKTRGFGSYVDERGSPVIGAYAWLPALQVALVVEQNEGEAFGPVLALSLVNATLAAAALLLALLTAWMVARGIAAPIRALSDAATRIAGGDLELVAEVSRSDEIGRLAQAFNHMTGRLRELIAELRSELAERKQAEEQVRRALAENEVLLRELHHRTKNNMNLIIALLDLQAAELGDERLRGAFAETKNRIFSMALVHQKLYEASDLSRIDLKDYIGALADLLAASYPVSALGLSISTELESVRVLIDSAIPCGLILNELITNALKYAFPCGRAGRIAIQLGMLESGEIQLRVADDGVGPPPGFDFRKDGRMGLQTVIVLGEGQLNGGISFDASRGVDVRIRFRDDQYKARV